MFEKVQDVRKNMAKTKAIPGLGFRAYLDPPM